MPQNVYHDYASDDIKLTDVIRATRNYSIYVLKKIWIVLIGAAIVGSAGYAFAKMSKTKYQANASFNVVDSRGMGGGISSLLNTFGFSMGSGTSNEGLSGIMQSRHAIKSAFLSPVEYKGKNEKLIHIFFEEYGFYEAWQGDPVMDSFKLEANSIFELTRKEDSVLNAMYNPFVEDFLEVEYEILQGLIKVAVKTYSYEFSRGMLDYMLDYSAQFFIEKQIAGKKNSIEVAQFKVDSLESALQGKRMRLAQLQDRSKYSQSAVGGVEMQRLTTEIAGLSVRAATSRDGLEVAKTSLLQDTPIINIVDRPSFATDIKKKKWKIWTLLGIAVGGVLTIIILLLAKAATDGFEKEREEEMIDYA
ncbi:MAG: hypothetical protein GY751_07765 [Bacteroidetes bacterium]|nr:hypothetical protein [Bacteroidota bacterium]